MLLKVARRLNLNTHVLARATAHPFSVPVSQHQRGKFHKHTIREDWFSDSSVYPLIVIMAGACTFAVGFMAWDAETNPDFRISKHSRKALLRGELNDMLENNDTEGIKRALGRSDGITSK